MINFFTTSFVSSLVECFVLSIIGGATVSSCWYLVLNFGFTPDTMIFFVLFLLISIPLIWIALFWIKALFVPSQRGKISIFSPLTTKFGQISFKNESLIPIIAGSWLTVWVFIISIGWCMAIRSSPIAYKNKHQIISYSPTCSSPGMNFSNWLHDTYIPSISKKQNLSISQRKFIVFQPSLSTNLESMINGLFTAFSLAIVSDRELLVDWPLEMHNLLRTPLWEWSFSKLFTAAPMTHAILDFVSSPSYIVPPSHKWKYADLLQENISEKMLLKDHIIFVDSDEFLAPLIWLNPNYRSFLCSLCDITNIFKVFSDALINFSDNVEVLAHKVESEINLSNSQGVVVGIADSTVGSKQHIIELTDTLSRCMDAVYPSADKWIIWKKGGGLSKFPKWTTIGNHHAIIFNDLKSLQDSDLIEREAVLYAITVGHAKAVVGFAGSPLLEFLTFSSGLPLYQVLHKFPVCGEIDIRVPCMKKWQQIINSPSINLSKFMTSEIMNQVKCNL